MSLYHSYKLFLVFQLKYVVFAYLCEDMIAQKEKCFYSRNKEISLDNRKRIRIGMI